MLGEDQSGVDKQEDRHSCMRNGKEDLSSNAVNIQTCACIIHFTQAFLPQLQLGLM